MSSTGIIPTLNEARTLLKKHNKEAFHLQHAETVSAVLAEFAKELDPERIEFWRIAGLLHDLDFEEEPERHCVAAAEWMEALGFDHTLIRAVASHGYGMTESPYKPEHIMEKVLYAVDELTGLIGAAMLMRPSKSTLDMNVSSIKKKFKDKRFAAGCSRDTIRQGAEMLGQPLDELFEKTLKAMQAAERAGVF